MYIDCIKGKYVRTFEKGATRSTKHFELIHNDICGTFPVKYVDGFDALSLSWMTSYIYPIHDSEAPENFDILKA